MPRIMTVKGTGNVRVAPDLVEITVTLDSVKRDYEAMMALASERLNALEGALVAIGFAHEDLKTASFDISVRHESIRDRNGNYKSQFMGYGCRQTVRISFDMDAGRIAEVLTAVSGCIAEPELNIRFTVKDQNAVSEELLVSATENARRKAEILARASGVTLGLLLNVHYSWGEMHLYSDTDYSCDKDMMAMPMAAKAMNFTPDDIDVSDNVTFEWEIR